MAFPAEERFSAKAECDVPVFYMGPSLPSDLRITYDCAQMLMFQVGQELIARSGQTWFSGWPSYSCYDAENTWFYARAQRAASAWSYLCT